MLTVEEFSAGDLNTMKPISLLRPIAQHEQEVLVAGSDERPIAVLLHEAHLYTSFEAASTSQWTGLILPKLKIELDETSAFDARYEYAPLGAVVRKGSELVMCTKSENFRGTANTPLITGLSSIGDSQVGFKRWQLVLGDGDRKRVMRSFDVTKAVQR